MEDGLVQVCLVVAAAKLTRLNPCCSGRWSRTMVRLIILQCLPHVLILVVVEDGLVLSQQQRIIVTLLSLNPCCSGRWSRTINFANFKSNSQSVLILVVVEDGLVLLRIFNESVAGVVS